MIFPKPEFLFTVRTICLIAAGIVATGSYYWILGKLKEAGIVTPVFGVGGVKGLLKTFETFRRLAPEKAWATWPAAVCWIAVAMGFLIVISMYFVPLR